MEDTLRTMYDALQRFAVGLEEIVLDQAIYGGFPQDFENAEFQIKYVSHLVRLCIMIATY